MRIQAGSPILRPNPSLLLQPQSPINTVAVSGFCAVSGSYDGTIKIYDLKSSTEIGLLPNLSSSITALSFSPLSSRTLISGDAEGSLSIYDDADDDSFALLNTVKKVHNNSVNSLSVHPSGKLACSVGQDEFMAIVNLVQGKRRFYIKLFEKASIIQFDESGNKFFMVVDEIVGVHDSANAQLIFDLKNLKRVLCVALGKNGVLFTAGEDRNITAWDTASGKAACTIKNAHNQHIKGIAVLSQVGNDSNDMDPYTVASAYGVIRIWDMRMANRNKRPIPLTETNTKSKLTCLAGSSFPSYPRLEMLEEDDNLDSAAMGSLFDLP